MSHYAHLGPFIASWPGLTAALGMVLLLRVLGRPVVKRWRCDISAVRAALRKLDPSLYHIYHDLQLPRPDRQGDIRFDHVVASPFGIFVIERMHFRGWIFGSAKQCLWTQQIRRRNRSFDNPLQQHRLHALALATYLGLSEEYFHPVTHFAGGSQFKTPMPDNVLNRGLRAWITRHSLPRLDPQALYRATSRLDSLSRSSQRAATATPAPAPLKAHSAG